MDFKPSLYFFVILVKQSELIMLTGPEHIQLIDDYESKIELLFKAQLDNKSKAKKSDSKTRKQYISRFIVNILKRKSDIEWALEHDHQRNPIQSNFLEIYGLINALKIIESSFEQKLQYELKEFEAEGYQTYLVKEPRGNCLLITPWNYPFQMPFILIGLAISCGNTVMFNMNQYSIYTNRVIKEIIAETFEPELVIAFEGNHVIVEKLLELPFDYINYTGVASIASLIKQKAAQKLIKVSLDVIGVNPLIIDEHEDYDAIAENILKGKFLNAGQTYFAPDQVYVPKKDVPRFITCLNKKLDQLKEEYTYFGPEFMQMVNYRQFDAILAMYEDAIDKGARDVASGSFDRRGLLIDPIILSNLDWDMEVMKEKIFGPILPVFGYESIDEVLAKPRTLQARLVNLYIFSQHPLFINKVIHFTDSKFVCLNDTFGKITHPEIPRKDTPMVNYFQEKIEQYFEDFTIARTIMMPKGFSFKNAETTVPKTKEHLFDYFTKLLGGRGTA